MKSQMYMQSHSLDKDLFESLGVPIEKWKGENPDELAKLIMKIKPPDNRTIQRLMKERRQILQWMGLIFRDRYLLRQQNKSLHAKMSALELDHKYIHRDQPGFAEFNKMQIELHNELKASHLSKLEAQLEFTLAELHRSMIKNKIHEQRAAQMEAEVQQILLNQRQNILRLSQSFAAHTMMTNAHQRLQQLRGAPLQMAPQSYPINMKSDQRNIRNRVSENYHSSEPHPKPTPINQQYHTISQQRSSDQIISQQLHFSGFNQASNLPLQFVNNNPGNSTGNTPSHHNDSSMIESVKLSIKHKSSLNEIDNLKKMIATMAQNDEKVKGLAQKPPKSPDMKKFARKKNNLKIETQIEEKKGESAQRFLTFPSDDGRGGTSTPKTPKQMIEQFRKQIDNENKRGSKRVPTRRMTTFGTQARTQTSSTPPGEKDRGFSSQVRKVISPISSGKDKIRSSNVQNLRSVERKAEEQNRPFSPSPNKDTRKQGSKTPEPFMTKKYSSPDITQPGKKTKRIEENRKIIQKKKIEQKKPVQSKGNMKEQNKGCQIQKTAITTPFNQQANPVLAEQIKPSIVGKAALVVNTNYEDSAEYEQPRVKSPIQETNVKKIPNYLKATKASTKQRIITDQRTNEIKSSVSNTPKMNIKSRNSNNLAAKKSDGVALKSPLSSGTGFFQRKSSTKITSKKETIKKQQQTTSSSSTSLKQKGRPFALREEHKQQFGKTDSENNFQEEKQPPVPESPPHHQKILTQTDSRSHSPLAKQKKSLKINSDKKAQNTKQSKEVFQSHQSKEEYCSHRLPVKQNYREEAIPKFGGSNLTSSKSANLTPMNRSSIQKNYTQEFINRTSGAKSPSGQLSKSQNLSALGTQSVATFDVAQLRGQTQVFSGGQQENSFSFDLGNLESKIYNTDAGVNEEHEESDEMDAENQEIKKILGNVSEVAEAPAAPSSCNIRTDQINHESVRQRKLLSVSSNNKEQSMDFQSRQKMVKQLVRAHNQQTSLQEYKSGTESKFKKSQRNFNAKFQRSNMSLLERKLTIEDVYLVTDPKAQSISLDPEDYESAYEKLRSHTPKPRISTTTKQFTPKQSQIPMLRPKSVTPRASLPSALFKYTKITHGGAKKSK